ncbi:MAG: ABC transporter permease [Methanomassiliicoccales archaeon]
MLVFFLAISILSPLLVLHSPEDYFAPQIDSYVASEQLVVQVFQNNANPYAPSASQLSTSGSYLLYISNSKGVTLGMGLGASSSTPAGHNFVLLNTSLPTNTYTERTLVFPLASYQQFLSSSTLGYSNYMLESITGNGSTTFRLSTIRWTGGISGEGVPMLVQNETTSITGNLLVEPATDSPEASSPLPPWVPFNNKDAIASGFNAGMLFAIVQNDTGKYIEAFYTQPLTRIWSIPLILNGSAAQPVFVGSYLNPGDAYHAALLIEDASSLMSFNPFSGRLLWNDTFPNGLNLAAGVYVPSDFQLEFSARNFVLVSSGNTLYGVYISNGTAFTIYHASTSIQSFASSSASSGFPGSIIMITQRHIYLISAVDRLYSNGKIPIPSHSGSFAYAPLYDAGSEIYVVSSTAGNIFAVSSVSGKYPLLWSANYAAGTSSSSPILFANAMSGGYSVASINEKGMLFVFSTIGRDINPLPPTLHTPSGNIYLFGTNIYGQDLWSQWVASFPVDLEVGLAVAAGTIIISVLVAMLVGYLGGFVGSALETVSLIIFLIPFIPLVIVMASILGDKSLLNIILVFILVGWPFTTFTLIGVVKSLKSRTFIEAAKVSGAGTMQILRRHMLSNMTPLLAYLTALGIGGAVGGISGLQVLGIGPLNIPTWGSMLNPFYSNFYLVARAWWWVIPPTVTLTAFVFAFVFISRGLDEVVNPRLRRR